MFQAIEEDRRSLLIQNYQQYKEEIEVARYRTTITEQTLTIQKELQQRKLELALKRKDRKDRREALNLAADNYTKEALAEAAVRQKETVERFTTVEERIQR